MEFEYNFHPVGQGLFASGLLSLSELEQEVDFLWVYDCGSSSKGTLVNTGIQTLREKAKQRECIDLLTISHLHNDHINGLHKLLGKFEIRTVLLPYVALPVRLALYFSQNESSPDYRDFYLNPHDYLKKAGVERVIFVQQGVVGPTPENMENERREDIRENKGEKEKVLLFWKNLTKNDSADDDIISNDADILKRGGKGLLSTSDEEGGMPAFWEFIPYNEEIPKGTVIPEGFHNEVMRRIEVLRSAEPGRVNNAIVELRKYYSDSFGKLPKKQNMISLFLYSGLIQNVATDYQRHCDFWCHHRWWCPRCHHDLRNRSGILYSGDGYLDTKSRLDGLVAALARGRIDRVCVFQVMHHGARSNCHCGVAPRIKPVFSIFSSDPYGKYGHPDFPVWLDFMKYGAVQVDKMKGFTLRGTWEAFPKLSDEIIRIRFFCDDVGHLCPFM
jgi:hypothetical protein